MQAIVRSPLCRDIRNRDRKPRQKGTPRFWRFAFLFGALFAVLAVRAGQQDQTSINFDAHRDAFTTPNRAGRAVESRKGTCNGDQELEFAWAHARRNDPSLPTLKEVERQILERSGPNGGQDYLLKIRELAQRLSYRAGGGGVQIEGTNGKLRMGNDTVSLTKAAVERGVPVRLLLSGTERTTDRNDQVVERPIFHTVTAYQTGEAGGTVGIRVADSSAPGGSGMLVFEGTRKGWEEVTEGDLGRVRWSRVDRISSPSGNPEVYRKLIDAARRSDNPRDIESRLNLDRVPSPSISAVIRDPKAGGVWIAFDPATMEGETSEAVIDEWVARTQAFLEAEGGAGLALTTKESVETAHLVSLRALLAEKAEFLGPLTRLHGYIATADGDVWLAGLAEKGKELIPFDLLIVALRTVWRQGLAPFISLDPDPRNFFGPPKPRYGDIPEDLHETAFIRILFAADYAMKEIILGSRPVEIPGYRSYRKIIAERKSPDTNVLARMWLTPLSAPVADVLETRRGGATAVWFQSRVQTLSEQMLPGLSGLTGTGRTDPAVDEASSLFTSHYEEIADRVPVFRRLAVVFDLAKACTLMRARAVSSSVLDEAAKRIPRSGEPGPADEPKPPFPGVGVIPVEGTDIVISGGAKIKFRLRPSGVVTTNRLAPLLDAVAARSQKPIEIKLPAVFELNAASVAGADAELSLSAAIADLRAGANASAAERLDRVLAVDPADADALKLRGLARVLDGHREQGLADIDRAVEIDPRQAALRALVLVSQGESGPALKDAARAERAAPEDEETLSHVALARLLALDLDGAEATMRRLAVLAPGYPFLEDLRNNLAILRSLPRARAEERLRLQRKIPQDLARSISRGAELIEINPSEAQAIFKDALASALASAEPAIRVLQVPECLRLLIGLAAFRTLPEAADLNRREIIDERVKPLREQADALISEFPDSAMGYLLRAVAESAVGRVEDAVAAFARAADRADKPDVVLDGIGVQWGTEHMVAMLGTSVAWSLWERRMDAGPVLSRCADLLGEGPAAKALRAVAKQPDLYLAEFLVQPSYDGAGFVPLKQMLERLRKVEEALDERPARDAVALWFLQVFEKAYLPLEQQIGGDSEQLFRSTLKFLRATKGVEARGVLADPIYKLRAAGFSMAGGAALSEAEDAFEEPDSKLSAAVDAQNGAAVRAALANFTSMVRTRFPSIRKKIEARLSEVERAAGSCARNAAALMILVGQEKIASLAASVSDARAIISIPGVKDSPEMQSYRGAVADAARHGFFLSETPADVLSRLVAAPRDAVEGETLIRFLPQARDIQRRLFRGAKSPVDFDKASLDLRIRLRLAAFGDSSAAGTKKFPCP